MLHMGSMAEYQVMLSATDGVRTRSKTTLIKKMSPQEEYEPGTDPSPIV